MCELKHALGVDKHLQQHSSGDIQNTGILWCLLIHRHLQFHNNILIYRNQNNILILYNSCIRINIPTILYRDTHKIKDYSIRYFSFLPQKQHRLSIEQSNSNLVSTDPTRVSPVPFLTHPSCDAHGCNSSGLGDDNIAVFVHLSIVIQYVLWHLSCLPWSSRPLNYRHLIALNSGNNLKRKNES